ncbi:MAG: DegT/DnrJ/EryC1/StrS family aminotransferase [Sporomusaceae bacterium]|nr:DegT/DnrJ/EryC1/StrS family aminotransferase [Sporomusaceae bacterium]
MRIPLVDLQQQTKLLQPKIMQEIEKIFASTAFIMGKTVTDFEADFSQVAGGATAVACNSGTDALVLLLEAMGVAAGDEVITTPFSFFSTAEAISRLGAVPVFVDIEETTFNLDPRKIEAAITAKTKAILPVHIFGQPADMEPILAIAKKHQLKVLEDACQAIGSSYTFSDGRTLAAGAIGDSAAFSFYPTKNLGGFGDGGMMTTTDENLAKVIRALRAHGSGKNGKEAYELLYGETVDLGEAETASADATIYDPTKYYNFLIGVNSRLDALQAAILSVKIKHLAGWNEARRRLSSRYDELFQAAGLADTLISQQTPDHIFAVKHLYIVKCQEREALCRFLGEAGVATGVYYPVPLHLQKVYQMGRYKLHYAAGDLPVSEKLCQETMALPLFPEMTVEQQDYVIAKVKEFYGK